MLTRAICSGGALCSAVGEALVKYVFHLLLSDALSKKKVSRQQEGL